MSPYLFLLSMEKLALLIHEKVDLNLWELVSIFSSRPKVSHIFFADDDLLFIKATFSQTQLAKEILDAFFSSSSCGFKINIHKSKFLSSINVSREKIDTPEAILGFFHSLNIGKYLGFPILTARIQKSNFAFILNNIWGD